MTRLYHGTNILFDTPDLEKCNPHKDFGCGFYLTPSPAGARRMAERAAARTPDGPRTRYVLAFDFDEPAAEAAHGLRIKRFGHPIDETFARFVMANRVPGSRAPDHNRDNRWDIVVGPIADDRMGVLFRRFELGLVSLSTVVSELRYKRLTIQYSFHTAKALGFLSFRGARRV